MAESETIQLTFFLRRRKGMSLEDFYHYWAHRHAPLVVGRAAVLGIRRYAQIYPLAEMSSRFSERNGLVVDSYDGVAEIWYEPKVFFAPRTAEQIQAADELLRDERNFIELSISPLEAGRQRVFWEDGRPAEPFASTETPEARG